METTALVVSIVEAAAVMIATVVAIWRGMNGKSSAAPVLVIIVGVIADLITSKIWSSLGVAWSHQMPGYLIYPWFFLVALFLGAMQIWGAIDAGTDPDPWHR